MKIGKTRLLTKFFQEQGRSDVVLWDIFPIEDGSKIKLIFESTTGEWRQGIWLMTDREIVVNAESSSSVVLWYDSSPKEVECLCKTSDGLLHIYNVWDENDGSGKQSQSYTSGMLVEELPMGRRYRCNDIGTNPAFDKMVFRVERLAG